MQTIINIGRIAKNKTKQKNNLIHKLGKKNENPHITQLIVRIKNKIIIRTVTKHITYPLTIEITITNIRTISIEAK